MFDRFLFVGLGGAGGSTLGYLKNNIRKWLQDNDAGSEIPAGWQFLHIDTPVFRDGPQRIDRRVSEDEYLGLIEPGMTFAAVAEMIDADPGLHDEMQTWRVDPATVNVPIGWGAGQFRAIGGTFAMAYAPAIRIKLEQAVTRMSTAQAQAEIGEVYHRVTGETPGTSSSLRVVVVSSLCGGTGAGLLQTVCDIIRISLDDRLDSAVMAYLYTPEVYKSLGTPATGGVQPNSLATICEILNGCWWNGSSSTDELNWGPAPLLRPSLIRAGLPKALTHSGPDIPFLIGRVNTSGVAYGTPDQVFAATAQKLASLVTDRELQTKLIAWQLNGRTANAMNHRIGPGTLVNEGDWGERGLPVFGAVGFARLSTGADYFEAYAARCLVREALVDVVNVHTDQEIAGAILEQLELGWEDLGMTPPQHDFTLIEPNEYPTLFESMLGESESADLAEELRETILALAQREDSLGESPPDLVNNLWAEIGSLEDRAKRWLRRPGTVFGDYLATSLRSYLAPTSLVDAGRVGEQEYQRRQNRFAEQWTAALDAAQPLINLGVVAMGLVHPVSGNRPLTSLSQVPFNDHPVMEQARVALLALGIDDLFTNNLAIRHVDIHTMLSAPHSVLVFESLLKPIAERWAEFVASENTQSFWSKRRSRPLNEFIPAPQALILCMVRGWLTALLLGRIDSADGPIRIARPGDSPAKFPYPFLSRGIGEVDDLPLALEALGLAYADVSTTGTLSPLDAYCTLRDLGRSGPDASLYTYVELNPDLLTWLETGTIAGSFVEPILNEGDDPEGRVVSLMNIVQASLTSYQEAWETERDNWTRNPISLSGPPQWTGLWNQIQLSHLQMLDAARDYWQRPGSGGAFLG